MIPFSASRWYVLSDKSTIQSIVPFRVLRHFTHKASVMSVNAEANVHSADWLMSVFVIVLARPHVRSEQGQCNEQCRRIMKDTIEKLNKNSIFVLKKCLMVWYIH